MTSSSKHEWIAETIFYCTLAAYLLIDEEPTEHDIYQWLVTFSLTKKFKNFGK